MATVSAPFGWSLVEWHCLDLTYTEQYFILSKNSVHTHTVNWPNYISHFLIFNGIKNDLFQFDAKLRDSLKLHRSGGLRANWSQLAKKLKQSTHKVIDEFENVQ